MVDLRLVELSEVMIVRCVFLFRTLESVWVGNLAGMGRSSFVLRGVNVCRADVTFGSMRSMRSGGT